MNTVDDIMVDNTLPASSAKRLEAELSDFEFRLLRDHIHNFCGIYFDDSKKGTLASRLSFRMKLLDIKSYAEYYSYLRYNPRSKDEMEDLIPHITNNETYFFREMNQLRFFVGDLLENIKKKKRGCGDKKIRILSCGCSSGEEAFTLAILLEEAGTRFSEWDVEITGIDIDRKVLEKASQGAYTSYSLRAAEKPSIEKYFEHDGDKYLLKDRIRGRVSFRRGNLLERSSLSAFTGADAIFCRNVFIYFSDEAIRSITESYYETLSDGGYLFLGHSESLSRITDIFYPKRYPNIIVYAKKDL